MTSAQVSLFKSETSSGRVTARIRTGGEEVIHGMADCWRKLCDETGSAPFHRPEWIAAYLRAFEPGSEVVLATASAGERLVAVLPMVRKKCWYAGVPVTMLAGAGNAHSVHFEIVRSACPDGQAALHAIWDLLRRDPGWQILQVPVFPQGGACEQLIDLARRDGHRTLTFLFQECPVLQMQNDADGRLNWLGGTSRHFRHELRRYARLLEEETGHKPVLQRWNGPDPEVMRKFFELEAAGWKGQEGSAIRCEPATRAFYEQIAREAAEQGYFCLHSLQANGAMTAGAFSVFTEQTFFPMKIAHDEALRRGGPGHLLFNGILEECAKNGIPELFFGGNKDRYKTSWTSQTLPHFNGFIFSTGLRAQLAYALRTRVLSPLGQLRRRFRERLAERKNAPRTGPGDGAKQEILTPER
ncbi:MAG TPA: GNAT family N-acetyltransferase [Candidatus Limnocylindrales bacterium]|nr:GNAT family N-acetyltransferase [Candidatus Limnocylindrales bacterium]